MTFNTRFTRTLIAASLMATAFAAHAVSLGATVDATTGLVTDTALTGSVKAKIAGDDRLNGADISVTTENGVVILTGTAPSLEAKAAAEQAAKSATSTVKVENRIQTPGLLGGITSSVGGITSGVANTARSATASTGEVITDGWITTKVKTQLLADTLTKGSAMRVKTIDNVVYLRGVVRSRAEKAQAIRLAAATEGVTRVNASKLKVATRASANANVNAR